MDQTLAAASTRMQLLQSARRLFAAQGYAGTSIAAIAQELGVTKQALLHHFGSKEALYALAVEQAAAEVLALLFDAMQEGRPPEDQLEAFCASLSQRLTEDATPAKLLLREMLDHALPTAAAGRSFATLLESLVATVQATARWQASGVQGALAVACQLLSAAVLLHAARDTVEGLWGAATATGACAQSPAIFAALAADTLRDA